MRPRQVGIDDDDIRLTRRSVGEGDPCCRPIGGNVDVRDWGGEVELRRVVTGDGHEGFDNLRHV